jgi:hypothetical protein
MSEKCVVLSVGAMELPEGVYHACFVPGGEMREVIAYEVGNDKFRIRWDTIIDGWQYTVSKWTPDHWHAGAIEFARTEREVTRRLLIDLYRSGVDLEAKRCQYAPHLVRK